MATSTRSVLAGNNDAMSRAELFLENDQNHMQPSSGLVYTLGSSPPIDAQGHYLGAGNEGQRSGNASPVSGAGSPLGHEKKTTDDGTYPPAWLEMEEPVPENASAASLSELNRDNERLNFENKKLTSALIMSVPMEDLMLPSKNGNAEEAYASFIVAKKRILDEIYNDNPDGFYADDKPWLMKRIDDFTILAERHKDKMMHLCYYTQVIVVLYGLWKDPENVELLNRHAKLSAGEFIGFKHTNELVSDDPRPIYEWYTGFYGIPYEITPSGWSPYNILLGAAFLIGLGLVITAAIELNAVKEVADSISNMWKGVGITGAALCVGSAAVAFFYPQRPVQHRLHRDELEIPEGGILAVDDSAENPAIQQVESPEPENGCGGLRPRSRGSSCGGAV